MSVSTQELEDAIERGKEKRAKYLLPETVKKEVETAIQNNDTEYFETITSENINKTNDPDQTPLILAVMNGKLEIVEVLLNKGADSNARDIEGQNALMYAAINGHREIVKSLLKPGANINAIDNLRRTPLMHAAMNGNLDIVQLLLDEGANINARDIEKKDALMHAIENGNPEVKDVVYRDHTNRNLNMLQLLRDTKGKEKSELIRAIKIKYIGIVQLLLNKVADINAKDRNGRTPLMHAAMNGNLEIVKLLLDEGANINAIDIYNQTPLMYAARRGNLEIVQLLLGKALESGNKDYINLNNTKDLTALDLANENNHMKIVKLLLDNPETIVPKNFTLNPKDTSSQEYLDAENTLGTIRNSKSVINGFMKNMPSKLTAGIFGMKPSPVYPWERFIKPVSQIKFLDSLVGNSIKENREAKTDLNIVRAQIALLHSIIPNKGDEAAKEMLASAKKIGLVSDLEEKEQTSICSKHSEILKKYPHASQIDKSLMCAFQEIAVYQMSHGPFVLLEGQNIFHFLALATIRSGRVGMKAKLVVVSRYWNKGNEMPEKTRDQDILDKVLEYLCDATKLETETSPSQLQDFLRSNTDIQNMLSAKDNAGISPLDIVASLSQESYSKCFITNIDSTNVRIDSTNVTEITSGGKSRRNRKHKQVKKTRKSKKSKKSRKTARK
uniref:Uncharacterized protein n=1 Tax=viral metagenome TaxID=1070528 RepID=A0A6C0JX86_9ZZZZ